MFTIRSTHIVPQTVSDDGSNHNAHTMKRVLEAMNLMAATGAVGAIWGLAKGPYEQLARTIDQLKAEYVA